MTTATTFAPTVAEATEAGFFPSRHEVEIVDNRELTDGVYRLTFRDEYIASHAKPAQFVDAVVGKGTAEFAELQAGDAVRVMGPLGNSFKTKEPANYVLVAGGLGVPPLVRAAQAIAGMQGATSTAVFGYRNVHFGDEYVGRYADSVYSIDESEGNGELKPVILSCGPLPMMKAVAAWAAKRGIECQLSLEQRMGCGYGTCVLCTVDTLDGRLKVCSDGPVFTRERLGWGE